MHIYSCLYLPKLEALKMTNLDGMLLELPQRASQMCGNCGKEKLPLREETLGGSGLSGVDHPPEAWGTCCCYPSSTAHGFHPSSVGLHWHDIQSVSWRFYPKQQGHVGTGMESSDSWRRGIDLACSVVGSDKRGGALWRAGSSSGGSTRRRSLDGRAQTYACIRTFK